MANEPNLDDLPQATVVRKKRGRISIVWIIPILAAVVAIGIAVQRILSEGPTITIVFKVAEGIEAGKTFIKYKDVNIGQVTAVQLSEDYAKVLVRAKIAKHAAGLMVKDAKFWVVEPRISLSGVSGLSTLLSGNYIGFEAGKSDEDERNFIGLDVPPPITDQKGRKFLLKATTLGSLGVGAPVYYRQINVGQVAAYNLAPDGKSVEITLFVNAPYDKYVTTRDAFLERQRYQRLGRRGRRGRAHGITDCAHRRRARLRRTPLCLPGPARPREHQLHALSQPDRGDEAARSDRAPLRALFRRVGARAVGRSAGNAVRLAGGRGRRAWA